MGSEVEVQGKRRVRTFQGLSILAGERWPELSFLLLSDFGGCGQRSVGHLMCILQSGI